MSRKEITFSGWAFQKDTNETRESTSIYVADELLNERVNIKVCDTEVPVYKMYADLDCLETRSKDEN